MQPKSCFHCREYVCMCVYGVRHVQIEWCTFRAEVCVRMLEQCSACAVRVVYLVCIACAVYTLHVNGVERVPRTCICTAFGMGLLSNTPTVRECTCGDVQPVRECVQFGTGGLSDVPIVRGCGDVGVHAILVLAE